MTVCLSFQVLCPKCDVGTMHQKSRSKKSRDAAQFIKKFSTKLESLCDVKRALSESKDSASAVSVFSVFPEEVQLCYNTVKNMPEIH